MQCNRPVWVRSRNGLRREVPCGNCLGCRISRAREWATRCIHEASLYRSSGFVSLTYSDDNVPADASVSKDELQRFFKRLREVHSGEPLRYYASGEYGELRGRPHYHAVIFGISPCVCGEWPEHLKGKLQLARCGCPGREEVMSAWKLGGVSRVTEVCYESARYTADYVGKSWTGGKAKEAYGKRAMPFQLMSKGIGRGFALANEAQLRQNLGVTVRGVPVGLPRYYSRKLGIEVQRERLDHEIKAVPASKMAGVWSGAVNDVVLRTALPRLQREADIVARDQMFKKGKE